MDPRQILVVLNVSIMKCIFMEEKIWKCFYVRLNQYAFVQRISIVERKEYMALRMPLAPGCFLCCSSFYNLKYLA